MNRSDLSFLEDIFKMPLEQIRYKILIVNQSKITRLESKYPHIRVINDEYFGLSRSRNLALSSTKACFAWILDDDVQVLPQAIETIIEALNAYQDVNLFIFKIITYQGMDKRKYVEKAKFLTKRKDLLHIHSIEMVCDVAYLKSKNLKFDQRFGLGAQFKMGEEYIVSKEILANRGKILFVPGSIVVHDHVSTGMNPIAHEVVYARGALAAHYNARGAPLMGLKYLCSLLIRGHIDEFKKSLYILKVFRNGSNDYMLSNKNSHNSM